MQAGETAGPAQADAPAQAGTADAAGPPGRAEMGVAGQRMAPLPAAGAARARPPATWPSGLWDGPVDLTQVIKQPTAGEAGRPVTAGPPSRPAALAAPAAPAGPTPGPVPGTTGGLDPGGSAAPGVGHQAPGQLVPPAPAAPGYLLPPPARNPDPGPALGPEPSGPSRKPGAPARPGVSIGTIEVTVVPPAPPLPEPPRTQAAHPVAKLAESAGTGRLRDGLRRWYGTAQG
jgi:translation initiation factor IF-2